MPDRPRPQPRFSQSFEYGAELLECFTAAHPVLQISELADMMQLSRSTTHRYATTLVALEHLQQDPQRRYLLSRRAAGAGVAVIDTIRLETPAARTILKDLREQTGHTVSMGALNGSRAIYLHRFFAHGAGQYEADGPHGVGAQVPLHCTAIGKALLASLSEPEQRAAIASLTLEQEGPNTIMNKQALVKELAHIRIDGIAISDEEQAPGVRSIATAIPHPGRSTPLAISITIPAQLYTVETTIATLGPHISAAAERI
jgi:DNA-binding IclR family transcriptional regulator